MARVPSRKAERDGETEMEQSFPRWGGPATISCLPFSSQGLGHARTHIHRVFQPPGTGLKPWSTTRESSDIAMTPCVGPSIKPYFYLLQVFSKGDMCHIIPFTPVWKPRRCISLYVVDRSETL